MLSPLYWDFPGMMWLSRLQSGCSVPLHSSGYSLWFLPEDSRWTSSHGRKPGLVLRLSQSCEGWGLWPTDSSSGGWEAPTAPTTPCSAMSLPSRCRGATGHFFSEPALIPPLPCPGPSQCSATGPLESPPFPWPSFLSLVHRHGHVFPVLEFPFWKSRATNLQAFGHQIPRNHKLRKEVMK